MVTFIFTKRMKRFYNFPTVFHISDSILLASSLTMIDWVVNNIEINLDGGPDMPKREYI